MTYDFSHNSIPVIVIEDDCPTTSPEVALQRGKFVGMMICLGCLSAIAFPGLNSVLQNSAGTLIRGGTPTAQQRTTNEKPETVQTPPSNEPKPTNDFKPSKDAPKFQKPLNGEIRIGSGFGPRIHPITRKPQKHSGIDLNPNLLDKKGNRISTKGQPILAVADGKVQAVGWLDKSCGNGVTVLHSGGYKSIYCHASKLLVKPDQSVKAGDKIALIGSTGASTGPHLQLGMKLNGESIDPKKVVPLN
jgi:murein DD-endopeptidase MepM/ murein hydrolase activator NlpD